MGNSQLLRELLGLMVIIMVLYHTMWKTRPVVWSVACSLCMQVDPRSTLKTGFLMIFVCIEFNVPVNNFSVTSGQNHRS